MKFPNNPYIRPRFYAFDYLGLTITRHLLRRLLAAHFSPAKQLRILDVGCGTAPWKALWDPYASEYVSLDIKPGPAVSVVASAEDIPLPNASFDAVFSNAVLEHVRGSRQAISEVHRVLKPGGTAIIGVPFIWPIHGSPHDYWRWTPHGLEQEFKSFASCQIEQAGGWLANYLMIKNAFLREWQERCLALRFLWTPAIILNNLIGHLFALRAQTFSSFATFYIVIAKK
ncbi:MAG: methyltransferase domain-containing protein [Kiritimatiellae bacterium]|nr:methyltransferase domain-containing protein [Kiritimatiellia bacterium]MCO5069129.1 methyltransferase domain-containing protein [Kiritimatiellia bacterium]